ncbi:MAG: protease modulator HflC [Gammaproteobacteria bacterium]
MMLQGKAILILIAGLLIVALLSMFTVDERERAIKFQLGRIVRADYTPGLYFKVPFLQNIQKLDARVQNMDAQPELYLTSEKKNLIVDSFVKWRIGDVERFYTATGGSPVLASDRISAFVRQRLRDEFGKRTLNDVVSGQRIEVMGILTSMVRGASETLGVDIIDVRIKRIDLPEEVSNSVYQRMSAEREEVAKDFRSRGEEAATIIRAKANREREVMLAEAERDAQRIRGQGDARAAEVYANAFEQNPEFYSLYRSLGAYRKAFSNESDVILMGPTTDFFKYFKDPQGRNSTGPLELPE